MSGKTYLLIAILILYVQAGYPQDIDILSPDLYGTASWENVDSLGNHRVILKVDRKSDAVIADIPWRLRQIGPEEKDVLIVDASNGKVVSNVYPLEINSEHGRFVFQALTAPGEYYVYYLTYKKEGSYYPKVTYYPFTRRYDPLWADKNRLNDRNKIKKLEHARLLKFQSIDDFNSFYPMEVMAGSGELKELAEKNNDTDYIVFTEDRKFPARSKVSVPYKWVLKGNCKDFTGVADRGEYYTFQVAVYAHKKAVNNIKIRFSDLTNQENGSSISSGNFTCFNTEGIDVSGNYFEKSCSVPAGSLGPMWIGVKIPSGMPAGKYHGRLTIISDGFSPQTVDLNIGITENTVESSGDNEIWRHSRLRWLNSTLGTDDEIVSPFTPLRLDRENRSIECLGRTVKLGKNGLPEQIISHFDEKLTSISGKGTEMLESPVEFKIVSGDKSSWEVLDFEYTRVTHGTVAWHTISKNEGFVLDCRAEMDFDGNIDYRLTLMSTADINVSDISLEVPLKKMIGKYMMGLGESGGFLKGDINWKWAVEKNQDGPWVGKENAGLQLRFRDTNYERPLNTNFYQQKPLHMPPSWYNEGKGGINISGDNNRVKIESYSGPRNIKKGDVFHYYFNLAITPFKPIDTRKQWSHRFYHRYLDLDSIAYYGANTVNIHHATDINPYINYPFLTPGPLKDYVDRAHEKGMKVKIYYTLRELSDHCPEIFALRTLGNEIFSEGNGGGYSWLQEHLDQNYIAGWFAANKTDAAIINSGVSRWHNYYVEGLNWLVQNIGIDGIYIDDLAFDRLTMKRMRKVLERSNPNTFLDLHSANQYNPRDGFANSANLYLEHMPYLDRLWFGEYFDYDKSPDFWMVEVSGIPYGLMGEMLQDGGNPWRGMLYGMTGRMPWKGAKVIRPIWDLWDEFEIQKSDMIGYWVDDNPVKTGSDSTLATSYVRKGVKTLVSLATWAENGETVKLTIDWESLGLDPSRAEIYSPLIEGFQPENTWNPNDEINVPAGKGYLLILRNR